MADAAPICTTGGGRVQTLVGRFALGAGSVALSQTFDLGGQTVVFGGQTRGCVQGLGWGALMEPDSFWRRFFGTYRFCQNCRPRDLVGAHFEVSAEAA